MTNSPFVYSWTIGVSISGQIQPIIIFSRYKNKINKDGSTIWGQFIDTAVEAAASRDMTLLMFDKDFEKEIDKPEYVNANFTIVDGVLYSDSSIGIKEGYKAFENFIRSKNVEGKMEFSI